jgi:hypothetical protein
MTASNRFVNVTNCAFTPTGGTAIPIKGVKSVTYSQNASDVSEGADADLINTTAGVVQIDPHVALEMINPATLNAVAPGTYGVLTWTTNDSRNGNVTGGGALIYTASNAYHMPMAEASQFRQFATSNPTFKTYSADGVTNPIAVAAA